MSGARLRTVRRCRRTVGGADGGETFDFIERPFAHFHKTGLRPDALGQKPVAPRTGEADAQRNSRQPEFERGAV